MAKRTFEQLETRRMLAILAVLLLVCSIPGCDPRIVQCAKCEEFVGMWGGMMPGQFSECPCGGRINKVRDLTWDDWNDAKKRGRLDLSDGEPVSVPWTPNYERAAERVEPPAWTPGNPTVERRS